MFANSITRALPEMMRNTSSRGGATLVPAAPPQPQRAGSLSACPRHAALRGPSRPPYRPCAPRGQGPTATILCTAPKPVRFSAALAVMEVSSVRGKADG